MYRVTFRSFLTAVALMATSTIALAVDTLTLDVDKSTMMELPGIPGAVVIANPLIADITIQGSKMFVLGRSFGTTNVILLDQSGNTLLHMDVSVRLESDNLVTVHKGATGSIANRYSYNCAPTCQPEVQTGDADLHNATTVTQIKAKLKLATGNTDTSSEAPPAPQ